MRNFKDRLRHTLMFEAIALGLLMSFGSWITGHAMAELGALGLMMSLMAMAWNFVFNYGFDLWDQTYRNMARRGALLRIAHAVMFEAGLLFFGLFVTVWWLSLSYWDAFLLDLGLSAFFVVYAFGFNWGYDVVFPVPRADTQVALDT